jgi:hypothetical protein
MAAKIIVGISRIKVSGIGTSEISCGYNGLTGQYDPPQPQTYYFNYQQGMLPAQLVRFSRRCRGVPSDGHTYIIVWANGQGTGIPDNNYGQAVWQSAPVVEPEYLYACAQNDTRIDCASSEGGFCCISGDVIKNACEVLTKSQEMYP